MLQHPRSFGFQLAMTVKVREDGLPETPVLESTARLKRPIVYVALIEDGAEFVPLKVGISKNGTCSRWMGTLGVMNEAIWHRLRPNEIEDGKRLRRLTAGKTITVWDKEPVVIRIPYAPSDTVQEVPGHHAEEIFLDRYYLPKFGMRL